jgi:hypothetical protein
MIVLGEVLLPSYICIMKLIYTDWKIAERFSLALGMDEPDALNSAVTDKANVVTFTEEQGMIAISADGKNRHVELAVFASGESILTEANRNTGVQLCTVLSHATREISRSSQRFDLEHGLLGVSVTMPLAEVVAEGARTRMERMARMVTLVLQP